MSKDKKIKRNETICIIICAVLLVLGIFVAPIIDRIAYENTIESHYLLDISSPDEDRLEVHLCEDNTGGFYGQEYPRPTYFYTNITEFSPYTISKTGISYIYVVEEVYNEGFYLTKTSDSFIFTYDSLMSNNGFANITLEDTYLLLVIIPWSVTTTITPPWG